jgi:hypothetical protein
VSVALQHMGRVRGWIACVIALNLKKKNDQLFDSPQHKGGKKITCFVAVLEPKKKGLILERKNYNLFHILQLGRSG